MKHFLLRTLLLILLTACGSTHAVTLGQIHVNSFLGEPLDAEIDLIGLAPGQHEDLRLRIANDRHFERLGIAHTQFLASLTFDVAQSGNRWIVRTRSSRPVAEPFLEFPLQMTWPGGQLIKQYTLLLDPPRRIQTARKARSTRPTASSSPAAPPPAGSSASEYGPVQPGETLWPIAKRLKPSGITTRQMAMALLRANPAAFIDGDINKLRAGATLAIPQQAFIEQLDAKAARAEFAALTRQPPVATSPRVLETPPPATSIQTAAVDEPQEPAPAAPVEEPEQPEQENQAQLRIVTDPDKSDAEPGSSQNLQEQLLVTMEEIESNRITTGAIESRLARMEAELERMQKLVELKDEQIAALESDVAAREAIQKAAEAAEPPAPAARPTPQRPITATNTAGSAPVTITRLEPIPMSQTPPAARPWYEEYVWVLWILLGLMGLTSLLMLIRRPRAHPDDVPMAQLPEVRSVPGPAGPRAESAPPAADLKEAEEDFRRLAEQRVKEARATPSLEREQTLPELDLSGISEPDEDLHSAITESLLDDMLDEKKARAGSPGIIVNDSEFSDDDIASWVAELGKEVESIDAHSANDERLAADDDIPSILTELDDQLSVDRSVDALSGVVELPERTERAHEDDTFNMSLDLARAYLEIGDQEGAREMLEQALSGARDPDHRRQIEELLQQID